MPSSPSPKRTARPRDADRTRTAILDAALALFTTRGYVTTGVRDVAERAQVNPALVIRYFGSKLGLFQATLERVDISGIFAGDRRRFGADLMAAVIDNPDASPLTMMMLSAADPEAHAASVEFLRSKLIAPLARWLGAPDAQARAAKISILWTGFLTNWKLLPVPPLDTARIASVRRWLETTTQDIVDEGGAGRRSRGPRARST